MKDIKDVVAWLEEEVAHYEILTNNYHIKDGLQYHITKEQEARYMMAQELVNWILGTKFNPRYSASAVSRETCDNNQEAR
jgi:hypothetical protein